MTTHDHQTMTDSYDESSTAVTETPPVSEHKAPAVSDESSTVSAEASGQSAPSPVVGDEQNQRPVVAADPSTASERPAPSGEAPAAAAGHASVEHESSTEEMLFADDRLAELRARWAAVQAAFVDNPKECVQKADDLVSNLVEQLTNSFAHARSRLEGQWARGEEASTEDLRMALMHYREFFERLLTV
jgi:hypothetical protein